MFHSLYTKEQMLKVMSSIGVTEPLPRKGKILIIAFPNGDEGRVSNSPHKSTYGKRMFRYLIRFRSELKS